MPTDRRLERQEALRATLLQEGVDALLVTHLPNIRYLTGFTGSAGLLLVGAGRTVLITDFRVSGADSTLGGVIAEAVRANLAQSSAVTLVSPASVATALRRMEQPDTSALTLPLAREVAAREGIKAIVDGDITAVGNGFVMPIRLVTADSASPLASAPGGT